MCDSETTVVVYILGIMNFLAGKCHSDNALAQYIHCELANPLKYSAFFVFLHEKQEDG